MEKKTQVEKIPADGILGPVHILGLEKGGPAILVNPSQALDQIEDILAKRSWHVKVILLSDGHLRHAARASEAAHMFQAPVWTYASELSRLQQLPILGDQAGLCGVKQPTIQKFLKSGQTLAVEGLQIEMGKNFFHINGIKVP